MNNTELENNISRSILRSQKAYDLYKSDKLYFQAKRIYNANFQIYGLLESYMQVCDLHMLENIFEYMFHLEDWFAQFRELEMTKVGLDAPFVFERFEKSIPFPSEFINKIKN